MRKRRKPGVMKMICLLIPRTVFMMTLSIFSVVVGLVVLNSLIVLPHAEDHLQKSIDFKLHEVEFAGVDSGLLNINVNVIGTTSVDYSALQNRYHETFYLWTGALLGSIKIRSQPISINVFETLQETGSFLGQVEAPPIRVRIENGSETQMVVPLRLHPNKTELFKFLKRLLDKMQNGEQSLPYRVQIDTSIRLTLGWVPVYRWWNLRIVKEVDLANVLVNTASLSLKLLELLMKEPSKEGKENSLKDLWGTVGALIEGLV